MKLTAPGTIGRSVQGKKSASAGGLLGGRAVTRGSARPQGYRRSAKVYGRIGDLEVRLASTRADLKLAQRLRYHVFYDEMSATPSLAAKMRGRDEDCYDAVCDHLLVVDTGRRNGSAGDGNGARKPLVVGTYRVLRQDVATRTLGFYTQREYDIAPLIAAKSPRYRFMELGRSCVLKAYRNKRTLELLWHGLWTYVRQHKVDVMLGCASFEGIDPDEHAVALSFLHHYARAPEDWRVRAHQELYVELNRRPKHEVDVKAALRSLPPLIKGYLRLGAFVGEGAVIDHQFGTTDVLIILPVERIDPRYFDHFGGPDEQESRVSCAARPASAAAKGGQGGRYEGNGNGRQAL
jgi:putative hemolysin